MSAKACPRIVSSTRVRVASGKTALSASAKVTVVEDVPPAITLGEPSAADTRQGPITFDVTYAGVTAITLDPADITINATGTVAATVSEITSTGGLTRAIAIDPISGDGTFTIAIAAGTANDSDGNQAPASSESAVVNVDNTAPTLEISGPSAANASIGPIDYLVNYGGADDITLTKAEIIERGLAMGLDYGLTHSCYDPSSDGRPCGRCDSCALRATGFREAGVVDPLVGR